MILLIKKDIKILVLLFKSTFIYFYLFIDLYIRSQLNKN